MVADSFFVQVQHRPRRVAFVVDPELCRGDVLDEIVDFNVCSWGGRYNPVIPFFKDDIPEPYWRLLQIVNPDLVYSFCDLPTQVVQRVLRDLRPLEVERHRPGQEFAPFRVRIDSQATVLPLLRSLNEKFPVWARTPEPEVLAFGFNDRHGLSSFAKRNLGCAEQFHLWCTNYRIPFFEPKADDAEIMKAVVANRNLATPIEICADGPR